MRKGSLDLTGLEVPHPKFDLLAHLWISLKYFRVVVPLLPLRVPPLPLTRSPLQPCSGPQSCCRVGTAGSVSHGKHLSLIFEHPLGLLHGRSQACGDVGRKVVLQQTAQAFGSGGQYHTDVQSYC